MVDLQQVHNIDLSIVIPTYNSGELVIELCKEIIVVCSPLQLNFEIIIVDDRSNDNTWKLLLTYVKETNYVKAIRLKRNFGQHNATCAGFHKANGKYILTIDDDFEASPSDIPVLHDEISNKNLEVVYGHFIQEDKALLRSFFKGIYKSIAILVDGKTRVNGSSFRILKKDLAKSISSIATNFVFIDEAILWHTEEIGYVDVTHHKSQRGKSHYSLIGLFKLTGEVVLYSSILPLKFVKHVGFLFAIVNFLIGFYFLVKKFLLGFPVKGYASIIVAVLFSTGMILFVLGILGEYLGKMFRVLNNRPVYKIDEEA